VLTRGNRWSGRTGGVRGLTFRDSGCKRRDVADKGVEKREKLAGQRIVAGIDESYYDEDDKFWAPIREADERDKAAHTRERRRRREAILRRKPLAF
jgi:hypothetical protein